MAAIPVPCERGYSSQGVRVLTLVQFPIADSRRYLTNTGSLVAPDWRNLRPDEDFVRFFGKIRNRNGGGLRGWVGENEVCYAARAFRFCRGLTYVSRGSQPPGSAQLEDVQQRVACVFRRLYSDGWAAGKLEVGLSFPSQNTPRIPPVPWLEFVLNQDVEVRDPTAPGEAFVRSKLGFAGKKLARLYARASTRSNFSDPAEWWVSACTPLLFLHEQSTEPPEWPETVHSLDLGKQDGLRMGYGRLRYGDVSFPLWMLWNQDDSGSAAGERREQARRLRIYAMRLHAEHEVLRQMLRLIHANKVAFMREAGPSNHLSDYLKRAISHIVELEARTEEAYPEVAAMARESLQSLFPGHAESLVEQLEELGIKLEVRQAAEEYVRKTVNITVSGGTVGVLNVSEQMEGVTNVVTQVAAPEAAVR